MLSINKKLLVPVSAGLVVLSLCSCSANMGTSPERRDYNNSGYNGVTRNGANTTHRGTGNGYGYDTGSYNFGMGAVTGGDTVGNSVDSMLGRNAVGGNNGLSGTSTRGTRNSGAMSSNAGKVNTNNGSADGGMGSRTTK